MPTKKPNAEHVWKQFEDLLVPRLRLSTTDSAVYSHLLRHSRLEGELRLQFSILWLARGTGICHNAARWAVRRLVAHGVLRLVERSKAGHLVEVRLPSEVRAARPARIARRPLSRSPRARCCLDHVARRAERRDNSCRNLVSCCQKCNVQKRDLPAADFLR